MIHVCSPFDLKRRKFDIWKFGGSNQLNSATGRVFEAQEIEQLKVGKLFCVLIFVSLSIQAQMNLEPLRTNVVHTRSRAWVVHPLFSSISDCCTKIPKDSSRSRCPSSHLKWIHEISIISIFQRCMDQVYVSTFRLLDQLGVPSLWQWINLVAQKAKAVGRVRIVVARGWSESHGKHPPIPLELC